jgi:hypothetical protein
MTQHDDLPLGQQCTLPNCTNPATDPSRTGALCAEHAPEIDTSSDRNSDQYRSDEIDNKTETHDGSDPGNRDERQRGATDTDQSCDLDSGAYTAADFTNPDSKVWPPALLECEQWMGHVGKKPFAPWSDSDHPDADPDEDARWKWGIQENYVDGETVAMAEVDDRLDGRAFLQQPDDPFAYVDGDDVRDPETGAVHPAFVAIIEHLGLTYADISQSGAGVHAIYRGELPDGVKQAAWQLDDDPWGANEELPSIEIYPGKRVCVMTGEHVPGTPTEVCEWNDGVLAALLEANDEVATSQRDAVSTTREDYDLDSYESKEMSSSETTSDIRDVFKAINRLDPHRVAEKTIVHQWNDDASTSDNTRAFVPTWGRTANGTANIVNDQIWQDTGDEGGYGGPVVMALLGADEMSHRNASPRKATGSLWWRGIEHLRDLGFDIPEFDPTPTADHTAVLPDVDDSAATDAWDWEHAAAQASQEEAVDGLSIDTAQERTRNKIADAYEGLDNALVDALPSCGKSYGAIAAAADTGTQITFLTGRGREEQYDQIEEWCDEQGLKHDTLPAFNEDCDTANGEHGEEWAERVFGWYKQGATPQEIHKYAETVLGRPLPCQTHEGQDCKYTNKWHSVDPDDTDVLIGHYTHAYQETVTKGRAVVVDEFPGEAYQTRLGPRLADVVTAFLGRHDAVPFNDYTDLIENRDDAQRRSDALLWFEEQGIDRDGRAVFEDEHAHADAPLVVFTLLAAEDLGNGWERATLDDGRIGLYNRENGTVTIHSPPPLEYARNVVALDGTPTQEMWEFVLGEHMNHRAVLSDPERREYIRDVLNLNLVRTTDAVKSYSCKKKDIENRVSIRQDAALLEAIGEKHGQRPALITTSRAEGVYDEHDILDLVDGRRHYGNVLGSNEFKERRLGAVIGSRNFGPDYVTKWGAFLGEAINPTFPSPENDFAPADYGEIGNKIRTHMRDHETLQAAMRFGRDGNGAVVYVHTDTLPDWVPLAGEGRVLKTWSDGMKGVLDALEGLGRATAAEIAEHPAVDVDRRQVAKHLETLRERGVLSRRRDPEDGRRFLWRDDGLHKVGEHGDVEIDTIDLDDLTEEEVLELTRSSIYTWEFQHSHRSSDSPPASSRPVGSPTTNVGDPPPHESD